MAAPLCYFCKKPVRKGTGIKRRLGYMHKSCAAKRK